MGNNIKLRGVRPAWIRFAVTAAVTFLLLGLWATTASAVDNVTAETGESGTVILKWTLGQSGSTIDISSSPNAPGLPVSYHAISQYKCTGLTNGQAYTFTIKETISAGFSSSQTITATPYSRAASFEVSVPQGLKAGESFAVTVKALKADGVNTETGYAGTRNISITWDAVSAPDGAPPVKPADNNVTFQNGVATIPGFTLYNSGETPVITVKDTDNKTGSSRPITLLPEAHIDFDVSARKLTASGQFFDIAVKAVDTYGNNVTSYTGTVGFSGGGELAQLPESYSFTEDDQGEKSVSGVILHMPGRQTLTVTDVNNEGLAKEAQITVLPVQKVAGGVWHAIAVRADGSVTGWGDPSDGVLDIPESLTDVVSVASSDYFSLALQKNGKASYWGQNLGSPNTQESGITGLDNVGQYPQERKMPWLCWQTVQSGDTVQSWETGFMMRICGSRAG